MNVGLPVLLVLSSGADAKLRKPQAIVEEQNAGKAQTLDMKRQISENIRHLAGSDGNAADKFDELLESDECTDFVEGKAKGLAQLLTIDDNIIIDYLCNGTHLLDITTDKMGAFEHDVAEHEGEKLTCNVAYESKFLESKSKFLELSSDPKACKEEISSELEIVHEAHRGVRILCPVCIIAWAAFLATGVIGFGADVLIEERQKGGGICGDQNPDDVWDGFWFRD